MEVKDLLDVIGADFYTGVPDSQLRALCDYLVNVYGTDKKHHIIAANEGNAAALASGYYLATGRVPVVYMQNSGEGNIINPVASLLNDKVYGIPCIFIIGWRGEPNVHDEPQHIYQGMVTLKLLEDMDIASCVLDKDMTADAFKEVFEGFKMPLAEGRQVALVVKKGALSYGEKVVYANDYEMRREDIIKHIIDYTGKDVIVSTTGKASRELFEARASNGQGHQYDFLTVGSMGHASSIALGVALNKPQSKVWCIDGDGAVLMHMGAMAVIGSNRPDNLVHIVINNNSHETVGGMPTVAGKIDMAAIAKACGYVNVASVDSFEALDRELERAKKAETLTFIEVKSAIGARADLGRPTTTAAENKENFMDYLKTLS